MIQQYQPEEDDVSADKLAEEISATRQRIDAKLAALADSFSPQNLLHNASQRVASRSPDEIVRGLERSYSKARRFVRQRPMGSAVVALGLTLMIFESLREKDDRRRRQRGPSQGPMLPELPPAETPVGSRYDI